MALKGRLSKLENRLGPQKEDQPWSYKLIRTPHGMTKAEHEAFIAKHTAVCKPYEWLVFTMAKIRQ